MHYAGVSCEMDSILAIAAASWLCRSSKMPRRESWPVTRTGALGAIGDLGSFSFHETKNIISGEGGSLLVRDEELAQRAEIIREKGTDRGRFFRGEVDKYTWQDIGSSFLPSEITAAFLWAQLEGGASASRVSGWTYGAAITPCWRRSSNRNAAPPDHSGGLPA